MDEDNKTKNEEQHLTVQKALQQCELVQNMIDISISSLEGLRTKCATSNDLTQKEIRTLEDIAPDQLTLEALLEMTDEEVCETVKKYGTNSEECARLNASLSCLRSVYKSGSSHSSQDWVIQWPTTETGKENTPVSQAESVIWPGCSITLSPKISSKFMQQDFHSVPVLGTNCTYTDRLTIGDPIGLYPTFESGPSSLPPSPRQRHPVHTPPRTPPIVTTMTPPGTPPVRRRNKLKPPGTPPPTSRKLIHLIPGFTSLHRSKSHEFQLGNRVEETHTPKAKKKNKPLNLKIHNSVGSCENIPAQRSPLLSERSLRSFFVGHPSFLPSTPPVHTEANFSSNTLSVPRWSPQIPRRDLGNSIKHRFSTKYWMSQTCTVCGKGMLFGLKCKNCKLKCHNKCTKEAPPCHLLIIHRGARLVRTESVPCDINNPLKKPPRYSDLHSSQTLPKTNKINKDHIPVPYQPDSSSNPSSTTSSTPSSPAPPLPPSATPPSPLHPSPQCTRQQKQFNLPGILSNIRLRTVTNSDLIESHSHTSPPQASHYFKYKQQFIFPDVTPEAQTRTPQVILHPVNSDPIGGNPTLRVEVNEPTSENEDVNDAYKSDGSEDDFEEMNLSLLSARNFPRKASQTSIFLQEWDIPFEQLEIGELIGKGRFGKVYHGRWHGEVAIRLIDIERDNEDHLKLFKREVMAYRQTRHENVVLFMGACMSPPHLAIITSLCKGRTLYSVVRDAKMVLDVNKTRQIAQEIVKGMGYLHAKGILHKDLKSKNIFYDNGKIIITDFGLFSISGALQEGRRESEMRIPNGWLCHLAPEIIQQLSPSTDEDKLPFSKQSDVFAFGTIWYELHTREWPFKNQPTDAIIWQAGRGMKPNLSQIGVGKEIADILLFCWAYEQEERPSFSKIVELLEKLPKRNRRLSHPGHFWKSAEYVSLSSNV
ncbi:kinase suppressor of Ras 2 isoform X2 [Mobula hypostoma]|uniref:kinase suppressor of Ras 2 isoform X2 n=1 Tax=Mobula hypostoma TaxID=723540 RepID=UPI002FC2C2A0